jgi:hypothetical protein
MGALRIPVVLAWTCLGTYLSLAGYFGVKLFENTSAAKISGGTSYLTYGDLSFRTRQDLQDFLLDETASRWFTWLPDIPANLMPLLACSAWGILGGAIQLIHRQLQAQSEPFLTVSHLTLIPILGAGVAVGVYLLAFLLPAVLTIGPHTMRAETLVALSFVSGIACERVYLWVQTVIGKLASD